jgi:tetratricopeptide (TPR) repeat protein
MERAWIFILLARQQGLDAVILAPADAEENTPVAGEIKPLHYWCMAVLIDGKAYLFDPLLGLPIPGKDGIRHDAQGRLEIQPAALAEIIADPALLKRLDIDSQKTYPVKPSDLRNLAALVEASPADLSYRMKLIESRLAGKQKMVLTVSATEQARRWKLLPGVGKAELWLLPYETMRRRSQLTAQEIAGQLGEFMRFYAIPNAPLAKGRLLQLKGLFSGEDGTTGFYQTARPPLEELGALSELPSSQDLDKMKQDLAKTKHDLVKANNDPSVAPSRFLQSQKQVLDEKMADVDLAKMAKKLEDEYTNILIKTRRFKSEEEKTAAKTAFQRQAMQIMVTNIRYGKEDATYWLALAAYDRGNYNSAEDYLSKRILEKMPDSPWRHGTFFNLAQTVEAAGQIERAAMIYQSDPNAPDSYGRLLRARWLLEKDKK